MDAIKKRYFIIFFVILVSIGGGYVFYNNSEYSKENPENELSNEKVELSNYNQLIDRIANEFTFRGYEEVLGETGNIVVVPDSITGKDEGLDSLGLYQRNKKYVYKNPENATVIILSISASENRDENMWEHSVYYTKDMFNYEIENASDKYPVTEVAQYSFMGDGYVVSVLGISDNIQNKDVFTVSEVAQFVDELSKYLKGNGEIDDEK